MELKITCLINIYLFNYLLYIQLLLLFLFNLQFSDVFRDFRYFFQQQSLLEN